MTALYGRAVAALVEEPLQRNVWRVVDALSVTPDRSRSVYLMGDEEEAPDGFPVYIARAPVDVPRLPFIQLPSQLGHVSSGDIISISDMGENLRVLWQRSAHHHSVLLTERCDNYCLMCSQPPKRADDHWLLDQARELVRLLPRDANGIIFTGGEPTVYGDGFLDLLGLCKALLPETQVHILSNGRRFRDETFASAYATIDNPGMMVGIPIYGTDPSRHDYVVQRQGAFDDTIRGILNLASLDQRIEIRVVVHKQTAPVLVDIARYIIRNLPFVEQVALMGLEITGFTRANLPDLWIDPVDYADDLAEAATLLNVSGIRTLIFNHQLCLIPEDVWRYTVKSISDWKNEYHDECQQCSVVHECGGFFASAVHKRSEHIRAIPARA